MSSRAVLCVLTGIIEFAHATSNTAEQRVLVWGTSTNGLGDVESILAIREFVSSVEGHPTAIILVTNDHQYAIVERHLKASVSGDYEKIDDVAQYVSGKVNLVKHFIPNWGWYGPCKQIMDMKKSAEEKIVHISASFDRSVCYFNQASVFVRDDKVFVTPENRVDNSLTIDEYNGQTTTLWLNPRRDYYFAYFYDDYCDTLARFLVTLRRLLQNPESPVRIVTNVRYCPDKMAHSMKYLFDTPSWSSSTKRHWTECNPGVKEMLRENGVVIHESGDVLTGVEVHGVLFVLDKIGQVSADKFDLLLLNSNEYAGCTGDSSLSKVLSSRRVPLYQVLRHKKEFVQSLKKMWKETSGDEQNFDMMMLSNKKLSHEELSYDAASFKVQFDRFIEKLFSQTTQHVLEAYLRSGVASTSTSNR